LAEAMQRLLSLALTKIRADGILAKDADSPDFVDAVMDFALEVPGGIRTR